MKKAMAVLEDKLKAEHQRRTEAEQQAAAAAAWAAGAEEWAATAAAQVQALEEANCGKDEAERRATEAEERAAHWERKYENHGEADARAAKAEAQVADDAAGSILAKVPDEAAAETEEEAQTLLKPQALIEEEKGQKQLPAADGFEDEDKDEQQQQQQQQPAPSAGDQDHSLLLLLPPQQGVVLVLGAVATARHGLPKGANGGTARGDRRKPRQREIASRNARCRIRSTWISWTTPRRACASSRAVSAPKRTWPSPSRPASSRSTSRRRT